MNAARTIHRAIAKLEELRAERDYSEVNGWLTETVTLGANGYEAFEQVPLTNDVLTVTLHRTIESQLTLLRMFVERIEQIPGYEPPIRSEHMALALAILGGDL